MTFKTKPYRHQLEAFHRFKDSELFALFMDCGTGKTKVTIDICAHKFLTNQVNACLIIAPNLVHSQWINEQFPIHCPIPYYSFIWTSVKYNMKIYKNHLDYFLTSDTKKLKVLAVNVEAFQSKTILPTIKEFVKNHNCLIVVDESTRIKTPKAKRSMVIYRLAKYGHRCILTGTPTTKSPIDLWGQFEFLKNNYFGINHFIFQHRYSIMRKDVNPKTDQMYQTLIDEKTFAIVKSKLKKMKISRGKFPLQPDDYEAIGIIMGMTERNIRYIDNQDKFVRFKRLDELKQTIKRDTFSVKKEDCLDLPTKIYEQIFIDLPKEHMKVYTNLRTELLAEYENKTLTVMNKVSLTIRLMQICGGFFPYKDENNKQKIKQIGNTNPKLERLKADLDDNYGQIIIWAQFVKELELVYQELKKQYSCALYYGGTEKSDRETIIKEFKAGNIQIFVGNPATAAFGLNLQNCSMQYYFSNSFKTELRIQAEDRSHRIGVKSACVYKDIIARNTIDERVFKIIQEGKDLNEFFKSKELKDII